MADQAPPSMPITPDQATQLQQRGWMDAPVAQKFIGPAVPPPPPPAKANPFDMMVNQASALGSQSRADNSPQARYLNSKKERLQDMEKAFSEKLVRAAGPMETGGGGGMLGENFQARREGRNLSQDELKAKYADEYNEIEALRKEIAQEEGAKALPVSGEEPYSDGIRTAEYTEGVDTPDAYLTGGGEPGSVRMGDPSPPSPMLAAYNNQIQSLRQAGLDGQMAAQEEANYLKAKNAEAQTLFAQQQAQIQQGIEKANEAIATLGKKQEKLAEMKVDPNRYWSNKTTGDKILAGIGLFLGASGGVVGRGNTAAQAIENAVEKDIRDQKDAISLGAANLASERGIYKDMLSAYGDAQMALNASRAAYFQGVENDIAAMAARAKGQQVKNQAEIMIAEIQLKRAEQEQALQNRAIMLAGFQTGQINPLMMDKDMRAAYVPGFGIAKSPQAAEALDKQVIEVRGATQSIQELLNIGKRPLKSITLEDKKQAATLRGMLQGNLRTLIVGPGAVSDSERAIIDMIIADPTSIFSLDSTNQMALKTLGKTLERNLMNNAQQYILMPIGPAMTQSNGGIRSMPRDEYQSNLQKASLNGR